MDQHDQQGPEGLVEEDNLTGTSVKGFSWTLAAVVGGLLAQLGYTAVMTRLLEPAAFGLVASAQAVLLAGRFLSELGIGRALVEADDIGPVEQRTVFTSSMLLSVALTAGLILGAPAVGLLFDIPEAVAVTRVLALVLLFNGFGITAEYMLLRQLRFKALSVINVGTFLFAYLLVGIPAALLGAGVWSLVAAAIAKAASEALIRVWVARHPMRWLLDRPSMRRLYGFGAQVSVVNLVEFLSGQAPIVAIGRFRGEVALGQFNRAQYLVELPFINLSNALADVIFPTVARLKHERERVGKAYLTAIGVTGALLLPVAAGIAVAADELVLMVLGDQWGTAATLLPILALTSGIMMVTHYAAIICEALAILKEKIAIQSLTLAILVGGFYVVRDGGLVSLVLIMLAAQVVRAVLYGVLMVAALRLHPGDQVRVLAGPALTAVLVAGGIHAWTDTLSGGLPLGLVVAGQVLIGAAVLLLSFWYGPMRRIRDDLLERLGFAEMDGNPVVRMIGLVMGPGHRPAATQDDGGEE